MFEKERFSLHLQHELEKCNGRLERFLKTQKNKRLNLGHSLMLGKYTDVILSANYTCL